MTNINRIRSTYVELEESHRYVELSDDDLYERMIYRKDERTSPHRSPRSQQLACQIARRLMVEVEGRRDEDKQLEEHFALEMEVPSSTLYALPEQRTASEEMMLEARPE